MSFPILESYLFFQGRSEEAVAFYQESLDARVEMLMRFKDNPDPSQNPPGFEEKVMHASLLIGSYRLMLSDGCSEEAPAFSGFSLSLTVADKDEAQRRFDALAEGGSVECPLTETFWSPCFGMVTDRFGVSWMISVPGQKPE